MDQYQQNQQLHLVYIVDMILEFLEALNETFPECRKTQATLHDFKTVIHPIPALQDAFVKEWHETMLHYYEACEKRDVQKFINSDIAILNQLDFASKWADPDFNEESRDNFWENINIINLNVRMYCGIPQNFMVKIHSIAGKMQSDIQNGTFNMQALVEEVQMSLEDQDIEDLQQNAESLQSIAMQMGLGDVMTTAKDMVKNNNMDDFSSLIQNLVSNYPTQQ